MIWHSARSKSGKFSSNAGLRRKSLINNRLKSRKDSASHNSDHSYLVSVSEPNQEVTGNQHDFEDIGAEETVRSELHNWREGRRVVDLFFLAKQLDNCVQCSLPLRLSDCIGETRMGLGGWLHIPCSNGACGQVNRIPLGNRHGENNKIWDVNTKLATGMIHSGLGETQVNNLLTSMNIPPVSKQTLKERELESGLAIEQVAGMAIEEAIEEEKQATANRLNRDISEVELTASVDGGWQSRGSGRYYNSLSGHVSMIGVETGKVIGYDVRSKSCSQCQINPHKNHECRHNWNGSSKAMEADMLVDILKSSLAKDIKVTKLVGDKDSSTIFRVRTEVSTDIHKLSDSNHIKKNLSNALYALKQFHKQLSVSVIKYLLRNFSYMCKENKGKPENIKLGLNALSCHPFGDHVSCSSSWCGYLQNPDGYTFKSLPQKRPLTDQVLKQSLGKLFAGYQPHVDKLADMSSSQPNESLNSTIASKAPKDKCYSKSASLNFRVGAGVAQKNMGYSYITAVNRRLLLSPGKMSSSRGTLLDRQTRRLRAMRRSLKGKRRRLQLKARNIVSNASSEIREGVTYKSNLNLAAEPPDTENIPSNTPQPVPTEVEDIENTHKIFFDLETTGFGNDAHITQIAATDGKNNFSCYVFPKKPITKQAEQVTGLSCNGQLLYKDKICVQAVSIKGLAVFHEFLF